MSRASIKRIFALCLAGCLAFLLVGCAQQASDADANDSVAANRQYMSSVNQAVAELSDRLQGFEDAVSRRDPITMRTQADDAFKVLDVLSTMEVPDDMKELNEGYVQACEMLEEALSSYIDLYSDISASRGGSDAQSIQEQIDQIQSKYDEGIDLLEATDKKATELQK